MGGKRRKLPHQRAGWKEMDQEPKAKRRRGGRKPANTSENEHGQGTEGSDMIHHQPQGDGRGDMYLVHHHDPQQHQQQNQRISEPNPGVSLGEMAAGTGNEEKPIENDFPQFPQPIQQAEPQPQQDDQLQPDT